MSRLSDPTVLAWLGLALVLAAIEVATLSFVFLMLAGSALAGAGVAAAGAPFPAQVVVSVVAGMLLLGVLRPLLVRRTRPGSPSLTGTAALVGRTAWVLETVTEADGRIKLSGEVWSARLARDGLPGDGDPGVTSVSPGQVVQVIAIEGATAVVTAGPRQQIGSQQEGTP
ncbi:MAG: NfeD family protein [Angustibacter sp.]